MNKRKITIPPRPSAAPDPGKQPRERRTLRVRFGGDPGDPGNDEGR